MQTKEYQGKALRYLVVEPDDYKAGRAYPMVVLLHGYGSHMGDLANLCPAIDRSGYLYVCPNAPLAMDLGFRSVGYAWINPPDWGDIISYQSVGNLINMTIEEVMVNYDILEGGVALGGFSQGGIVTLMMGLSNPDSFRGLVALSASVIDQDGLRSLLPSDRSQAIFISHGTTDTVIPVSEGRIARQFLMAEGYLPDYHEYSMAHEITGHVVSDLTLWLHTVLPPLA